MAALDPAADAPVAPSGKLAAKTLLVTGASRGLGAAIARQAAGEGAHIIALARTTAGLEELDDAIRTAGIGSATLVPLDVEDAESVDRLAAPLLERFGAIHGLVHAAGGHLGLAPVCDVTPKDFAATIEVNLTSAYRLVRALHPLLRAGAPSHAVFFTDATPPDPPAYWAPYAAAKAGLAALIAGYGAEAKPSGVSVHVVDPGPMATKLRARAFPGSDPHNPPTPGAAAAKVVDLLAGG